MIDERMKYAEKEEQRGEGILAHLVHGRLGLCTKQGVAHQFSARVGHWRMLQRSNIATAEHASPLPPAQFPIDRAPHV